MSVTNDAPVGGSAGLSALPKNTLENHVPQAFAADVLLVSFGAKKLQS